MPTAPRTGERSSERQLIAGRNGNSEIEDVILALVSSAENAAQNA